MDTFLGMQVHMDFEGQKLAERLYQMIIILFGAVGWLYGYYVQDFLMTVITMGAGFVLAFLVVLPPWPVYRRHPLKWAPLVSSSESTDTSTGVTTRRMKKK